MNPRQPHTRLLYQRGISMVELMITLLLGLILAGGMLQMFSSNKSTYTTIKGISHIQDNARAGLERMKSHIRMTGYMGCSNLGILDPNDVTNPNGSANFRTDSLITGTNNNSASGDDIIDGTDTINIIAARLVNTALSTDMTADNAPLSLLSNPGHFHPGDLLLITDCENADIFRVTDVNGLNIEHGTHNPDDGTQVNAVDKLSKSYLAISTRMMSLLNLTYSVEDTGTTDTSGNAIWSLFETPAGGTRTEIMTGVEDMQITYGEDTGSDGEVDVYNEASAVTSWGNVISIRLRMLISTGRDIGPELRPYLNLAGSIATGDRRIRRIFTTTISLRNRSS